MTESRNASIDDLSTADAVIDARTPAEFDEDHVPGAINCPTLSNDERHIVGTLYKEQGAFEARRVGGAMVAANLATHLRTAFADRPRRWKPVVYCWRGGLRSAAMVQWLRLVGWDARQLAGGYKTWRTHVIATIAARAPALDFVVLCGPTGSAKTRVLHALAARGEQVLDLEAHANHRGSVLGLVTGTVQPSQKRFETCIAATLAAADPARPVYVEAESRRIGRLALPTPLFERMRFSPSIAIDADRAARLAFLLEDYAFLGEDRDDLARRIELLRGLQSNETVARWVEWAKAGALEPLFDDLMEHHYDPMYARSTQRRSEGPPMQIVRSGSLDAAHVDRLADEIIGTREPIRLDRPTTGDP